MIPSSRLRKVLACLLAGTSLFLSGCENPPVQPPPVRNSSPPAAAIPVRSSRRVLMIGDSLTVGNFGTGMERYLTGKFGGSNIFIYGSCGSSVQHWLGSNPVFSSRCGYRESTPSRHYLYADTGRYHSAPKVEDLLRKSRPDTVIVQLGTNHFDKFQQKGMGIIEDQRAIFEDFANALTRTTGSVRKVIWITPPDSAKFSPAIEAAVDRLIRDTCRRHGFMMVDSKKLTHYVRGVTGSDGVHYAKVPALEWADQVTRAINGRF